mgnify:CR=1 FL=1
MAVVFSTRPGGVAVSQRLTIYCESMERAEEAAGRSYLEIIQLSARYLHPTSIVLCAPQRDQYGPFNKLGSRTRFTDAADKNKADETDCGPKQKNHAKKRL